jgi:hypothetical protein
LPISTRTEHGCCACCHDRRHALLIISVLRCYRLTVHATCNMQHNTICSIQYATYNMQHTICNIQPTTCAHTQALLHSHAHVPRARAHTNARMRARPHACECGADTTTARRQAAKSRHTAITFLERRFKAPAVAHAHTRGELVRWRLCSHQRMHEMLTCDRTCPCDQ